MSRFITLLLVFYHSNLICVNAQQTTYRFVNFGTKDGLQEKTVYQAVQDKKGYMWFGTASGLYRYDGHMFKYQRSPIDKPGHSIANILQAIHCDKSGNLWLGSFTDLQWYNPSKNIFWQPDISKPAIKKITASYFYGFSESERYVWLSTAKNFVYRFSKSDSSFLSLAPQYPAGASTTSLFTTEYNHVLYDIHPEGIYLLNTAGKFIRFFAYQPGDITGGSFDANEKCIYLPTLSTGLQKFDITSSGFVAIAPDVPQLKKNNLFCVYKNQNSSLLIGAHNLFLLPSQNSQVIDFLDKEKENEFGLQANKIVKIVGDKEGNTWFCSHNGLSMLPWQNSQVKTITLKDETTGYITEPIGAYQEPGTKNILLLNTNSRGLQHVNLTTGKVTTIVNQQEPLLYKKRINSLIIAPDSTVFVSDGLHTFKYNAATLSLAPYSLLDQNGKPLLEATRFAVNKTGIVFIGSYRNGFYKWNYGNGKLWHYSKKDVINSDANEPDNNFAPCITDSKGNIWFTSDNGVYKYSQQDDKFYHYLPSGNDDIPVMGASRFIAEDKIGHIWITTNSNGLYELWLDNNNKTQWKNYTVNSGIGLPTDFCNKILQSPFDSCLWLNNTAGLLRFDPVKKKVLSVITKQNGLASHGFGYTFNVFANKTMVQLFYGAVNIIDFNGYQFNEMAPSVTLNVAKVLSKDWLNELDSNGQVMMLSHNENFLQFEFAALQYNNTNQMQYACMLVGADKDWNYIGQTNTAVYSGLKPGQYTFKVRAANNDGVWGKTTEVNITIRKPIYARWWFLLTAVALGAMLVYWWSQQRVLQAKKEEKLKSAFQQQIAETELKALRAQMNPHFIFNSLNSIQKYILKNEHFEASQYLTKFSRLIRLILDQSHESSILLSSEIDLLNLYLDMESLRFDNKFNYQLVIDPAINQDTMEIPSMLIQPFVENAIWHGLLHKPDKGKLSVRFSKSIDNYIQVEIEDNGVGRQKAAELKSKQVLRKKSYGMEITDNRIAVINKLYGINASAQITDLADSHGQALGTLVKLTIPLTPIKH